MMEILKKHGASAGIASILVLAITFVPIFYQYRTTVTQNARIAQLEAKVEKLSTK